MHRIELPSLDSSKVNTSREYSLRENVEKFHRQALTLPTYFPRINSGQSTKVNSGQLTRNDDGDDSDIRIGTERNAVYIRDTNVHHESGGHGSVFKVLQKGTDHVFGAKELHWRGSDNSGTAIYNRGD